MCAQVPCTPPGPIIIRLTSAGGSYIRLVLLNVRTPLPVSAHPGTAIAFGLRMQETIHVSWPDPSPCLRCELA